MSVIGGRRQDTLSFHTQIKGVSAPTVPPRHPPPAPPSLPRSADVESLLARWHQTSLFLLLFLSLLKAALLPPPFLSCLRLLSLPPVPGISKAFCFLHSVHRRQRRPIHDASFFVLFFFCVPICFTSSNPCNGGTTTMQHSQQDAHTHTRSHSGTDPLKPHSALFNWTLEQRTAASGSC